MFVTTTISNFAGSTASLVKNTIDEGFLLLSQIGYTENKKFSYLRYWPSYLSGAIAVASAVAAIAMQAFNNMSMSIFLGVIAIGSGFLAGTLHIFIPLKKLEEQTALYGQQNQALQIQNEALLRTKNMLEQTARTLSEDLAKHSEEHRSLSEDMTRRLSQLGTLTSSLLTTDKKKKEFDGVVQAIREATTNFQTHSAAIQALQQNLSEKSRAVVQATIDLSHVTERLTAQLTELKKQHETALEEYKSATSIAGNLAHLFTSMQAINTTTKAEEEQISQHLGSIKHAEDTIVSTTTSFMRTAEAFSRLLADAQQKASAELKK